MQQMVKPLKKVKLNLIGYRLYFECNRDKPAVNNPYANIRLNDKNIRKMEGVFNKSISEFPQPENPLQPSPPFA